MNALPAIIINAAGRGTRLGQERPKCLVPFQGEPLIHWQLQAIPRDVAIIVAIGFQADKVRAVVGPRRPDAKFVFNEHYATTGTASSLSLAARKHGGPVLSLDGDMLVHPHDLLRLLHAPRPCIGLSPIQSNAPVLIEIQHAAGSEEEYAERFLYQVAAPDSSICHEWTGLVVFDPSTISLEADGHVFQMITPLLPCSVIHVRCREIDYPDELPIMDRWIKSLIREGILHG